jgi:hypothetical protein
MEELKEQVKHKENKLLVEATLSRLWPYSGLDKCGMQERAEYRRESRGSKENV